VLRYINNPNKEEKRQKVSASLTIDRIINSHSYGRFDQEFYQEELVKMYKLSFRFVKHLAFGRYSNAL